MGCLGIKMPKLRYEQDCSSPSPISHDKEIRAVLIAAERGTEHTALSMRVHASHLTPWKMWYFCSKFLRNLELHRVLWGSGVSFRKTGGNVFPEAIINKQLHQIVVIRHPSRLKNHREKKCFFNELTLRGGMLAGLTPLPSVREPLVLSRRHFLYFATHTKPQLAPHSLLMSPCCFFLVMSVLQRVLMPG